MQGHKITSADAVKAYLQSLLNSLAETWVRLPREVWPESRFDEHGRPRYKRPVIRLLRSLYGHPEAGAHWERKLEQELLDMGAVRVPEYPSTCMFPSYGHLALVVYVGDFLLSGDSSFHDAFGQSCQSESWLRTLVIWEGSWEDIIQLYHMKDMNNLLLT